MIAQYVLIFQKVKVPIVRAAHRMVEEDVAIVTAADQAEDMAADAAEAAIVATAVVPVAEDTKRAMVADRATDHLIKVVATAEVIQAVQQPVRIRIEAAAGQLQAENPGIKNKPENREGRRRGFS